MILLLLLFLFSYSQAVALAESILHLTPYLFKDALSSSIVYEFLILFLQVFGSGIYLSWSKVPYYWVWLRELSYVTQTTRAALIHLMTHIKYKCNLNDNNECIGPEGEYFACQSINEDGVSCTVSGRTILYVTQGIGYDESYVDSFIYLIVMLVAINLLQALFIRFPLGRIAFYIKDTVSLGLLRHVLSGVLDRKILDHKLNHLTRLSYRNNADLVHRYDSEEFDTSADDQLLKNNALSAAHHRKYTKLDSARNNPVVPSLTWRRLVIKFKGTGKKGRKILDNVSGIAKAGRVLAIMGPSGAGTSTLLNALSNRAVYANVTGDIRYCGRSLTITDFVFVPQVNELNDELTVVEQLELIGCMRCSNIAAMKKRLYNLLIVLELYKKSHEKCSHLSLSEMKRVGVCMGMVSDPNILFLDEPTFGLDNSAGKTIIEHLVKLAHNNRVAVVMTMHQPPAAIFNMLQDLCLLEGGKLAFFGPVMDAKRFFGALGHQCPDWVSPADFYLDLIYNPPTDNKNITWKDLYLSFNFSAIMTAKDGVERIEDDDEENLRPPSSWIKFQLSLVYFYNHYSRSFWHYKARMMFFIITAVFLGTLYLNLQPDLKNSKRYVGAIFVSIVFIVNATAASVSLSVKDHRQAMENCKAGITSPMIHCLSQFLIAIPFNLLVSIVYSSIFHWLANLCPYFGVFVYEIIMTCGLFLAIESLLLMISQWTKTVKASQQVMKIVMGLILIFSGFYVQVIDLPVYIRWISYIMPTKVQYYYECIIHSKLSF